MHNWSRTLRTGRPGAARWGLAVPAVALLVGLLLAGCQSDRSSRSSEETLTDSLAEGYQWLEKQYERMGEPMPQAMRGMQGRMQAMHDQMMEGRGGGMGRMKERKGQRKGMMGGREGSRRDTTGRQFRMGHGDMSAMHETMARMHGEKRAQVAARHRQMARWHEKMMGGEAAESARAPGKNTREGDDAARSGEAVFAQQCASCHGQTGQGVSETFPPLVGSAWVTGDVSVLARIVLHGLEGPIDVSGQRFDGVMPAFGNRLSNSEMAELLTYLRTSLNEEESSVRAQEIARIRNSYDRSRAWSAEALRANLEGGE